MIRLVAVATSVLALSAACGSRPRAERPVKPLMCVGDSVPGVRCSGGTHEPSGIHGNLVDGAGEPVAGARLLFVGAKTHKRFAVRTRSDGVFELVRLPRDEYDVHAEAGTLLHGFTYSATRWVHIDLVTPSPR